MKTPVSELNLQQLTLVIARHLYPWTKVNGDDKNFKLDWQTMGPLWERENENYRQSRWAIDSGRVVQGDFGALIDCFAASKSPESIGRALLTMRYPEGIEL